MTQLERILQDVQNYVRFIQNSMKMELAGIVRYKEGDFIRYMDPSSKEMIHATVSRWEVNFVYDGRDTVDERTRCFISFWGTPNGKDVTEHLFNVYGLETLQDDLRKGHGREVICPSRKKPTLAMLWWWYNEDLLYQSQIAEVKDFARRSVEHIKWTKKTEPEPYDDRPIGRPIHDDDDWLDDGPIGRPIHDE